MSASGDHSFHLSNKRESHLKKESQLQNYYLNVGNESDHCEKKKVVKMIFNTGKNHKKVPFLKRFDGFQEANIYKFRPFHS